MSIPNPKIFRANLVNEFNKIIDDKILSINLEKSIYNYCINECKKKGL